MIDPFSTRIAYAWQHAAGIALRSSFTFPHAAQSHVSPDGAFREVRLAAQ